MAPTPQFGAMIFMGLSTGQKYNRDIYLADVNAALINWDGGAGASATSPEEWIAPEPVALIDFAIVTGTADTEKLQITRNGIPTGDMLRYTLYLSTLANRPAPNIFFAAGARIAAIQIAD